MEPGKRVGPYEIVSRLGAGGMGEVWRARDLRLGREVAIKVLPPELAADPERRRRFEREARAMAALSHPNVVEIHDVGVHEGEPYLVEELLDGESLRVRLVDGALGVRETLELGVQIARGLAAAHDKRIVHRDLKPGNVIITRNGTAKIVDFGLAKVMEAAPEEKTVTAVAGSTGVGRVMGTVAYMAPEQARGHVVDHRADIFALGVVLYEMLAGERPFGGETASDVIASLLRDRPPPLPDTVPSLLRRIVARCLEKRPEDRFASAHDVALVIQAGQSRGSQPLRAEILQSRRRRRSDRMRPWIVGAFVIFGLAGVWAWFAARHRGAPLPQFRPRQVTSRPGVEGAPAISPAGTEIAYSGNDAGSPDIWVVDARGGQPLRLTSLPGAETDPAWLPDGSAVVFVDQAGERSSIAKVPRFGGSPVCLVTDGYEPAISPDGRRIAFTRQAPNGFLRVFEAPLDAPERARMVSGVEGGLWDHNNPAWSPDGREVAYQDQNDVWVVPVAGGPPRNVTGDHAADFDPAWSADGRHVYFASLREGTGAIWRVARSGGQPERVTIGTGSERSPSVSADGRRLAYATHDETTTLVLVDTATGRRTRIEESRLVYGHTLAPDGGALAFVSNREGEFDLWLLRLRDGRPVGEPERLTDQGGTCASPAFSPDGAWLAYHRIAGGQRDVWVIAAAGGVGVNLTDHAASDAFPDWAPDGRRIAFVSDRGGASQVWVAGVAGGRPAGEPVQLTRASGAVFLPAWSPDGRSVAYIEGSSGGSDVWVVDADGTGLPVQATRDAAAAFVGWDFRTGRLLVVGSWSDGRLGLRSLRAPGAAPERVPHAMPSAPAAWVADYDLSRDGRVLSLMEQNVRRNIWVLESLNRRF